jgi:trimeric autotransporter adhesin
MTSLKRGLISACFAWCAVTALMASEHSGMVTFHGLPVPGALVTAVQGDQKFTTSTDDDGTYSFRNLPDGTWTITVEMGGFDKASREVGVGPGAPPPTWDLKLAQPQAAPAPPATATSAPGAPGSAPGGRGGPGGPVPPGAPAGGRGAPQMTPEQARARAAAQLVAQDNAQSRAAAVAATTASPGGDSVTLAGSLGGGGGAGGASFGNNVGGGSQYSGNAAFSLDNSIWDANSYSLSGIQTPKPAFAKGRITTSFGGPLKIPHLLSGKNSTFILNYSMGRTRNGSTSSYTMPSALERIGDFSQSVVQGPVIVYDPTTGQPFPANIIPKSRISSAALTLANYYPLPNAPGRLNYQTSLVSVSNQDNLNTRLNHKIGKKDRISGGVGWQRSNGVNPNVFDFVDKTSNYGVNANAAWNHTFSPRLIQNATINFSRSRTDLTPYFASLNQNIAQQLGIQGTSSLPQNWGPPNLSFSNFSGLSDGNASLSRNQTLNLGYSINLVRAKHQWTFGADFRRQQINPLSDPNGRGTFNFTGLATTGSNGAGGYDFADFLLNLPSVANIRFGNADKYFRTWKLDGYVSDNWTISKALTANLGIRYDYTAPFTELYNRMANLDIGPGFSSAPVVVAGQSGKFSGSLPSSLIKPDRTAFSPNIGLSWRPFAKNPKMPTQVRFSFSQIHPLDAYSPIANNLSGQPPFAKALSLASSAAAPLTMQTAFLNSPAFSNTYAVDPNYKLLSVSQAMLLVIQPLPKGYYTVTGVVYAEASHLDQSYLPNSLPPGLTAPVNGPPVGFIYEQSNARLHATVGVFQVGRNMANGLSASASLQTARAIDNGAVIGLGGTNLAQNWQDLNAEKATSALVPKAQLNGNWQYSTGQGKAGGTLLKGWKGGLLKDWTFTNGFTWRAGTPLTATVAGNRSTVGGTGITGTVRADATGLDIGAPSGSTQPFNLAAFSVPAPGSWGNAGRNTIQGPNIWGINASLGRVFRLGERRSADLRFDSTNFINHVVVNGWSTVVNAYNYGLPTGTQSMRSLTANLRFRF